MNGLVVLAACVCAASGQLLAAPAWAINQQSHQFHAQDEFGQFSFGHAGGPSARTESRNAYGVTQGSYQYVDANGLLQTVNYIADPVNGFRVAATNLPVAPTFALEGPVFNLVGPVQVEDTPEVAAAKAEFQIAFDAAVAAAAAAPEEAEEVVAEEAEEVVAEEVIAERKRRQAEVIAAPALPYPYAAGIFAAAPANIVANIAPGGLPAAYAGLPAAYAGLPAGYAGLPAGYAGLPAAYAGLPAAYAGLPAATVSAPASREAVLTTVQLNPGHAVSYRVD